ncbi:MATE family efflux transporter [Streptomyces sp. NBC_01190]|uniref:MATE family efflux transporter n=1 Tax=Streptomyces sp. NBC_01190 TaxID=2903767 RepID=UPI00386AF9B1|nr:MATE family efflux transporter [Streptomyces sp. NBC_01190]
MADHTRFTARNFSGLAVLMFTLSMVTVGFGAVDMVMIAPKGITAVAAVGQADVLVAAIFAFFTGVVDAFSSRLAIAEGEGSTAMRLPVLAGAMALALVPCQLVGVALAAGTGPALSLFGQKHELIPLITDYVGVRCCAVVPVLVYVAINETLKICGLRNLSALVLVLGFAVNACLNWAFLYTGCSHLFSSPSAAVAYATVVAQTLMALSGALLLRRQLRVRLMGFQRPQLDSVTQEFRSLARTAPGIGVRHLNDYMGSVIPLLFIGTMGVATLAAANIATKIYTLFCRVPQACFAATFVFHGYALGREKAVPRAMVRRLAAYCAAPTAVAVVGTVLASSWLVSLFSDGSLPGPLARNLLLAYLSYLPAYFFEQFFGELLTNHQRGGLLMVSSSVITYALTIPLALYTVFVVHSPFFAIASKGVSTAVLAVVFWRVLRGEQTRSPLVVVGRESEVGVA